MMRILISDLAKKKINFNDKYMEIFNIISF